MFWNIVPLLGPKIVFIFLYGQKNFCIPMLKKLRLSTKKNRQILLKSKIITNCDFSNYFFTCGHWKRCLWTFNVATTIFIQQSMMQIPSLFLCNNIMYIITVFCGQMVSFYLSKLSTERHTFSSHIKLKLLQSGEIKIYVLLIFFLVWRMFVKWSKIVLSGLPGTALQTLLST